MIAGARVDVAPFKRDPMDFVLWKPSDAETPGWDSPWGRGRPGWHIECSAMSHELLGPAFDIHGGGIDLQFPHHENEIAQSHCAHPEDGFAKVWMHNEMLQVEGKKMSKSLGNFFTVRDLLDQGVPGEVIRFVLLGTHYSKPMDWTAEKAAAAEAKLSDFVRIAAQYADLDVVKGLSPDPVILQALADDLNTHLALQHLDVLANHAKGSELAANLIFLGLFDEASLTARIGSLRAALAGLHPLALRLQEVRLAAQKDKDFAPVDAFKARLTEAGVVVQMRKDGVDLAPGASFDPAKLAVLE
jgi:cysteinyl-tRNA synthetase